MPNDEITQRGLGDLDMDMDSNTPEESYRITPLGVLALHMPLDVARSALAALEDCARRYEGVGIPALVFNGGGGRFVKIIHASPQK